MADTCPFLFQKNIGMACDSLTRFSNLKKIAGFSEEMEAEQKRKKQKTVFVTQLKKKARLGLMIAQTPRACTSTSDSAGRFRRRFRCSTLFIYSINLSMCDTFLIKLIPSLDNSSRLLPTPKETPNLNLSAITFWMWSFRAPTTIFCSETLYLSIFSSLKKMRVEPAQPKF